MKANEDIDAYLARIQRTVDASRELVEKVELRVAETDRLLASQGLTREQVLAMSFTPAQRRAVNDELRRRGLPEMEPGDAPVRAADESTPRFGAGERDGDAENRRRKFRTMMQFCRL